jgi:hypothetical protein
VSPALSFHALAEAITQTSIWQVDYDAVIAEFLTAGPRLEPLARELLSQPGAAWWFAPLNRDRQLFNSYTGYEREIITGPFAPRIPDRAPTPWERYAQKPEWGFFTSTDVAGDGLSSFLVGSSKCAGDLGPLTFPVSRMWLVVSPDARVFEVDGPESWRQLCLRYPAPFEHGQVVPDFAAVAREWDAVHLGFGGLLTAEQVRLEGPEGWTWLNGWDAEGTMWLRWAFDEVVPLPPLTEPVRAPAPFR